MFAWIVKILIWSVHCSGRKIVQNKERECKPKQTQQEINIQAVKIVEITGPKRVRQKDDEEDQDRVREGRNDMVMTGDDMQE